MENSLALRLEVQRKYHQNKNIEINRDKVELLEKNKVRNVPLEHGEKNFIICTGC